MPLSFQPFVPDRYTDFSVLNKNPLVAYAEAFLSPDECEHIKAVAAQQLRPAMVSLDDHSALIPGRSGSNCWIRYSDDAIVRQIGQRVADLVGIPLENAESLQVIHYAEEQEYKPHWDAYDLSTVRGQRCCTWGGQRLLTALIYLNDVPAGGGTAFPKLDLQVAARAGRVVVFQNVDPEQTTLPLPASLHGGMPVQQGEKWACNLWFHERPMQERQVFTPPTTATSISQTQLTCIANRATQIVNAAVEGLRTELPNTAEPVCFTYWDTLGGQTLPPERLPSSGRVLRLIDRRLSNTLANKKTLMEKLRQSGTQDLAPPAYDSIAEAVANHKPEEWPLWFCKPIFGSAGKGMYCLHFRDLPTHTLPPNYIIQASASDLALIDGKKCTTRIYVLLWNQDIYLFQNGFVICNGPDFTPDSIDYKVQISHEGYVDGSSGVRMIPLKSHSDYPSYFAGLQKLTHRLRPVLAECLAATSLDQYLVLGIDTLISTSGHANLVEINNYPNFIHTPEIINEVNVPFFQSVLRLQMGFPDGQMLACV